MNCTFQTITSNHHKCSRCGFEIKILQDPAKIYRQCEKIKQDTIPTSPSLGEKIVNFANSMVEYAQSGFEDVTDEEHNKRMDICKGCEFFQAGTCQKCGCSCNFKSRMKAMKCPIGKW